MSIIAEMFTSHPFWFLLLVTILFSSLNGFVRAIRGTPTMVFKHETKEES